MIALYKNIKNKRLALGMSQDELAHKVGYADKGMISRIENGKVDLPQSKIKEFADVLGVTPGQLMGWEDELSELRKEMLRLELEGADAKKECNIKLLNEIEEQKEYISLLYRERYDALLKEKYKDSLNISLSSSEAIDASSKENAKALELYELYQKAPVNIQEAINNLLRQ